MSEELKKMIDDWEFYTKKELVSALADAYFKLERRHNFALDYIHDDLTHERQRQLQEDWDDETRHPYKTT